MILFSAASPRFSRFLLVSHSISRRLSSISPVSADNTVPTLKKTQKDRIVCVQEDGSGYRMDRWLRKRFPSLPHSFIQKAFRTGKIRRIDPIDGAHRRVHADDTTKTGDQLFIGLKFWFDLNNTTSQSRAARSAFPITAEQAKRIQDCVLFMNDDLICLNKPSGLATQGGSKVDLHVDGLLDALRFGRSERPRLVHRLDRESSGVLVLARSRDAAHFLHDWFSYRRPKECKYLNSQMDSKLGSFFNFSRNGNFLRVDPKENSMYIKKAYWAFLTGSPKPTSGRIRTLLQKNEIDGREYVVASSFDDNNEKGRQSDRSDARIAVTEYHTIESAGDVGSLVEMFPITGRTHQLRVHSAQILSTPILGDSKYHPEGSRPENYRAVYSSCGLQQNPKLFLHARQIVLPYKNQFGEFLCVTAPLPEHFQRLLSYFSIKTS